MVRATRVDDGIRSNLPCLLHSVKVLTINKGRHENCRYRSVFSVTLLTQR